VISRSWGTGEIRSCWSMATKSLVTLDE
jgi:hypothetical protein